ncbi:hypothetical protein HDV03_004201 [Kappamyces sp. JEL0829]|nr:hypothetical protein HDV03_004201 [Kappamyces sp. JEL0829]KAJ3349994.1 hypothetical protein HDU91_006313 [Kappamyces sp. JEL0680]
MFASVLLASRLESNYKVSLLMFSAVLLFALLPIFRRTLRNTKSSALLDSLMAVALTGLAFVSFLDYSPQTALLHLVFSFGVTFVSPYILVGLQKYKR